MGFIEEYKHLEKLCGEIFDADTGRGISAYIDEMTHIKNGSYYVPAWNNDLKNLKHYRWIRNQIVHEPNCTERNMCEYKDELWLENFRSRIMKQTDPLALYLKAIKNYQASRSKEIHKIETHQPLKPKRISIFKKIATLLLVMIFIAVLISLIYFSEYH